MKHHHLVHPRQHHLPLHLPLIQAQLHIDVTSVTGFQFTCRRPTRPHTLRTTSDISRYATISDTSRLGPGQTFGDKERPTNPYPYPSNSKPTPHQIFHLRPGATQAEIKERYYDLVRTHHPDSFHARLSTHNNIAEAHSRFRSIKAAYDFLRGRTVSPDPNATPPPSPQNFDPYMHELARRRRAYNASRQNFGKTQWAEGFGAPKQERKQEWNENGKKERLILLFGVVALVGGLFPSLPITLVSLIFPTSILPSSIFPFSLFESSLSTPPSQSDPPPPCLSVPPSSSMFSFFLGLNKTQRAAAALSEARQDARDVGVERREGVRQRVKEMTKETGVEKEEESMTREQQ